MRVTVRLHGSGKVTIPAAVRDELKLTNGDLVELHVTPTEARSGDDE
mgnify:CR=1 FL=1